MKDIFLAKFGFLVKLIFLVFFGGFFMVYFSGCFIQDFNKNARSVGYRDLDSGGFVGDFSGSSAREVESSAESKKGFFKRLQAKGKKSGAKEHGEIKLSEQEILGELLAQQKIWQGTPYVTGGVAREGADCSGFVMSVFGESFGISLPRVTVAQMKSGKEISKRHAKLEKLRAGDLVFFKTGQGMYGYHVGIYLSGGEFVHLSTKGGAKIANMQNSYWKPKLRKIVRYIE